MLSESLATVLVGVLEVYVALGLLFALPFVVQGVGRVDLAAIGGTRGFRLLILPGVVAFWPVLALRWLRGAPPPEESNAHRRAARRGVAGGGAGR